MSFGFEVGYHMVEDERGAGEPEMEGKASQQYFDTIGRLRGAALAAFEEAVKRGRQQAEHDLKFEW